MLRLTDLLEGSRALAEAGFITGASGRNWQAYGERVQLPAGFSDTDRALLSDPQTSGGLLVSCDAGSVGAVLEIFQRHSFYQATEIGCVGAGNTTSGDRPSLELTIH